MKYANITLRIGTDGKLKEDWRRLEERSILGSVFDRQTAHELKIYVTICTVYHYDARRYTVTPCITTTGRKSAKVESTRYNDKRVFNKPFLTPHDLKVLQEIFRKINTRVVQNKQTLQGFLIDKVEITTKQNAGIETLATIPLSGK